MNKSKADISWTDLFKAKQLTIEKLWTLTANIFFAGKQIPKIQHDKMRKAYYAGFAECFKVMSDFAGNLPEDQACDFFSQLSLEIDKFIDQEIKEAKSRMN